jgi:hypothetical protein
LNCFIASVLPSAKKCFLAWSATRVTQQVEPENINGRFKKISHPGAAAGRAAMLQYVQRMKDWVGAFFGQRRVFNMLCTQHVLLLARNMRTATCERVLFASRSEVA